MNGKCKSGESTWKDPDDAPALTDAFFERATLYDRERVIQRGRPKVENPKAQVTLRLDADVLTELRATGPGWQTRANTVLKHWLANEHRHQG